jgi:pantothenate kinase type III
VALPAVHWKVTLEELKVDPGTGLTITAAPEVGVGVGVALPPGVGVGVGALEHVANLNEPMRVTQFPPATGKYIFVYQKVQSSTGSTVIAL